MKAPQMDSMHCVELISFAIRRLFCHHCVSKRDSLTWDEAMGNIAISQVRQGRDSSAAASIFPNCLLCPRTSTSTAAASISCRPIPD